MDVNVMQSYEDLFGKRSSECRPEQAIAHIVQNPDGTRRLEPSRIADTTSPEFQRLLGPQGTLAATLGIQGVGAAGPTGCPTGATGCYVDPFFHFPDLDRDSADCLYIPTFNDVPMTISMATYFFDAFFKEVPFQEVQNTINQESKEIINDIVYGNIYFNYVPLTVLLLVIIWVFIIHGTINWETGVFLTAVIITVLWLGFLLFDTYTRGITGDVFTRIYDEVENNFQAKNEAIICNILKGYYTAVNHMMLPEAAICKSSNLASPTGCGCIDTGISKTFKHRGKSVTANVKIPNPTNIINRQIQLGGMNRCDGIDNSQTLLPIIDETCPCISDVQGFTLSELSEAKKTELFDCVLDKIGLESDLEIDVLKLFACSDPGSTFNKGLCALVCPTLQCSTQGTPLSLLIEGCSTLFPP